ncbi:hypothetical protein [Chromobacterium amazonense]|uniref:hypothetical protein n=1 Tax=Chromobacterium amazonense TaxID=1382803 RepID=UPI001114045C|nr:hypothetical protein [Chromobacterium amazonense]
MLEEKKTNNEANNITSYDDNLNIELWPKTSIPININSTYNPASNLITDKYSPIHKSNITDGNEALTIDELIKNRVTELESITGEKKRIQYQFEKILKIEDDKSPILVVSSNRAIWIAEKLLDGELVKKHDPNQDHVTTASTIWYDPSLTGRKLWIIVHDSEYVKYKKILSRFKDITIIGFRIGGANHSGIQLTGFGACRLAALEIIKKVGIETAWLVDDNVTNINKIKKEQISELEEIIKKEGITTIGFNAASEIEIDKKYSIVDLQSKTLEKGSLNKESVKLSEKNKMLINQQAVLINVKKIGNVSFNPIFISSNEDTSLSYYLIGSGHKLAQYLGHSIKKTKPFSDNSTDRTNALARLYGEDNKVAIYEIDKITNIENYMSKLTEKLINHLVNEIKNPEKNTFLSDGTVNGAVRIARKLRLESESNKNKSISHMTECLMRDKIKFQRLTNDFNWFETQWTIDFY